MPQGSAPAQGRSSPLLPSRRASHEGHVPWGGLPSSKVMCWCGTNYRGRSGFNSHYLTVPGVRTPCGLSRVFCLRSQQVLVQELAKVGFDMEVLDFQAHPGRSQFLAVVGLRSPFPAASWGTLSDLMGHPHSFSSNPSSSASDASHPPFLLPCCCC